mmetsp:Transcript_42859/g.104165  ORF Transcript_42859/g.104165 Transcript_42859/m.104165 type:complete len:233 (-) Transcript_42859:86-784(-)
MAGVNLRLRQLVAARQLRREQRLEGRRARGVDVRLDVSRGQVGHEPAGQADGPRAGHLLSQVACEGSAQLLAPLRVGERLARRARARAARQAEHRDEQLVAEGGVGDLARPLLRGGVGRLVVHPPLRRRARRAKLEPLVLPLLVFRRHQAREQSHQRSTNLGAQDASVGVRHRAGHVLQVAQRRRGLLCRMRRELHIARGSLKGDEASLRTIIGELAQPLDVQLDHRLELDP